MAVFFYMEQGELILADGKRFSGFLPGKIKKGRPGEVVFNTGMTGYVESLTDPSYSGQILTLTYPLIGNYGALSEKEWESKKVHVAGVVVSELSREWSHSGSSMSLIKWLDSQNVPLITGVDTRALTKHLRVLGVMNGVIGGSPARLKGYKYETPKILPKIPSSHKAGDKKQIVLIDCGAKENILRSLLKFPANIKRVPAGYDFTDENFDGVVISNGPGDPTDYADAIAIVKKVMKKDKPLFGICLGIQLLGLAAGAKTYKLKFGHRGHNQPCRNENNNKCYITSQNHGYAIDAKTLPKNWKVSYINLNDGSVEGIEHKTKPFFAVQFHPEASPGPTDNAWLFNKFWEML